MTITRYRFTGLQQTNTGRVRTWDASKMLEQASGVSSPHQNKQENPYQYAHARKHFVF